MGIMTCLGDWQLKASMQDDRPHSGNPEEVKTAEVCWTRRKSNERSPDQGHSAGHTGPTEELTWLRKECRVLPFLGEIL